MKAQRTAIKPQVVDDKFLSVLFGNGINSSESYSDREWIAKIRSGLPVAVIGELAEKMEVPQKDIARWLHTTPRTIQRSVESNSLLGLDMSDRVGQLIRVFTRCKQVFGDSKKVATWLKTPNYALGNVAPNDLLDTIPGMELVLDEIGRIEHGVFI